MAYDSSRFAISWNGEAARGLAEGDAVTWEFDNNEASSYSGVRGEGDIVFSPDRRCTITVRLQATSPTNKTWDAFATVKTVGQIVLRDRSSAQVVGFGQKAAVTKKPTATRGRDMPIVEWVFTCPDATLAHIGEA